VAIRIEASTFNYGRDA